MQNIVKEGIEIFKCSNRRNVKSVEYVLKLNQMRILVRNYKALIEMNDI